MGLSVGDGGFRAVVWDGDTPVDLNTLVPEAWAGRLLIAGHVNDRGQIVGTARDVATGGTQAFVATPAPRAPLRRPSRGGRGARHTPVPGSRRRAGGRHRGREDRPRPLPGRPTAARFAERVAPSVGVGSSCPCCGSMRRTPHCRSSGDRLPYRPMASVAEEIQLDASPDDVWAAVRDIGAAHVRLFPGVLAGVEVDGDVRTVTFANGLVVRERVVTLDDGRRRFVYTSVGGRAEHHNASLLVVRAEDGRARVLWSTDVLPDSMAPGVADLMRLGADAMRRAFARAAPPPLRE